MLKFAAALAAGSLLLTTGLSAQAATVYSRIDAPLAKGSYALDIAFLSPAAGSYEVEGEYRYNIFEKPSNEYIYGNEEPFYGASGDFLDTRRLTVRIEALGSGIIDYGSEYEIYSNSSWLNLYLDSDYGTEYTYSFRAVPEPTTWAMMVLGFGLAGAGLRRRRPQLA